MKNVKLLVILFCVLTTLISGCSSKKNVRANPNSLVERRTGETVGNDKDVEKEIKETLRDDENHRFFHVNVNVYNGAVLLTGEVMDEAIKSKIIETVRVISHVKMVHDNLIIDYPSDNLSRANDKRIVQNIKRALTQIRTLPNFDSSLIKVIVEQSTVYLMGRVHRDEGTVVVNVVRLEPDIRQIVTVLDYID